MNGAVNNIPSGKICDGLLEGDLPWDEGLECCMEMGLCIFCRKDLLQVPLRCSGFSIGVNVRSVKRVNV